MSKRTDTLVKWAAIAIGFFVPISVALDNVLLLAVLILWLAGGRFAEKYRIIRENPVAIAAFALFCMLTAGMFWGRTPLSDALGTLGKYIDLLFVPIFVTLFEDRAARRNALRAFLASMLLTLLLSYLIRFGFLHTNSIIRGFAANPYVFKLHITQNFFMSFAVLMLASLALKAEGVGERALWILLAALATFNIFLMVQGRIGYLVSAVLLLYLFARKFGKQGMALGGGAVLLLGCIAYFGSHEFHERIDLAIHEAVLWHPGQATKDSDSIGQRLEYDVNTLGIVSKHPFFGVGTGGFPRAYADQVAGTGMIPVHHPHNEFLLITSQLGVAGLLLLLLLFYLQWREAGMLGLERRFLGEGLVLAMISGCLFNSFLLDHAEGLFFAWMSGVLFSGRRSD
ncbi:MAG: O-antigen ligase family protein [Burkholderiales bacterium]|nr:O-antigen ligase family protein [Burkholderiales bacterium]